MTDISQPLISVITICLNSAGTIRSTITSVLSQGYSRLEYIIVDGGSEDGTLDIIREFRSDIAAFVTERDRGIADAFNKGLTLAHGDLVGFMNADDRYENGALIRMAGAYTIGNKSADIVFGEVISASQGADPFVVRAILPEKSGVLTPFICHQGMLAKKDLFSRAGGFDERWRFGMDFDWILRCLKHGATIAVVPGGPVARYSADGISGRNALVALIEFRRIALENGLGSFRVNAYYFWTILKALVQQGLFSIGLKRTVIALKARLKSKYSPMPGQ